MDEPLTAVAVALLGVVVVAGAVMLSASRIPGRERWVRVGFVVIVAVFIGLIAYYALGGMIGGNGGNGD